MKRQSDRQPDEKVDRHPAGETREGQHRRRWIMFDRIDGDILHHSWPPQNIERRPEATRAIFSGRSTGTKVPIIQTNDKVISDLHGEDAPNVEVAVANDEGRDPRVQRALNSNENHTNTLCRGVAQKMSYRHRGTPLIGLGATNGEGRDQRVQDAK